MIHLFNYKVTSTVVKCQCTPSQEAPLSLWCDWSAVVKMFQKLEKKWTAARIKKPCSWLGGLLQGSFLSLAFAMNSSSRFRFTLCPQLLLPRPGWETRSEAARQVLHVFMPLQSVWSAAGQKCRAADGGGGWGWWGWSGLPLSKPAF